MNVNFSFIIPHKNSPELLIRCVNSIPIREDIEIIVVDDNSSPDVISKIKHLNINLICLNNNDSNGAGHARNIGLQKAIGKWVFFADADDTYCDSLSKWLDLFLNKNEDVIYFNYSIIKNEKINDKVCKYIEEDKCDVFGLKYKVTVPWNKIIKKKFIDQYNIRFEETPVGNDILFTYQVGYHSKSNFSFIDKPLYYYHINGSSIIHKKKNNEIYYLTLCKHIFQIKSFYKFLDNKTYRKSLFSKFVSVLVKKGLFQALLLLKVFICNYKEIINQSNYFINILKNGCANKELNNKQSIIRDEKQSI